MENELEIKKANKQGDQMNEPSDVVGRESKGMLGADSLVSGGEDGRDESPLGGKGRDDGVIH